MKKIIIGFLIVCWAGNLFAQRDDNPVMGKISFMSSQNVYVKFGSTKDIRQGDTLFIRENDKQVPVLIVNNLSTTSCVCTPISKINLSVSMQIYASNKNIILEDVKKKNKLIVTANQISEDTIKSENEDKKEKSRYVQKISGNVSASSYSYFSNLTYLNSSRYRYQFSLSARNINNSPFSAEINTAFQHEKGNWDTIQKNIYQALKIYNLSVKYDNKKNTQIVLGRKINPKISSMGAIDGLQYEGNFKHFFVGLIAGSRPNYQDYSFDFNLLQFGSYFGHNYSNSNGQMQNSLAFIEQTNSSKTDRRFAYFQHSNTLAKNLYMFGSLEIDLYKNIDSIAQNTFDLSSAYLLLNYRLFKKLSLSVTYDNRKNIIYYESYKSFINQVLDIEARQGLSFQANYYNYKNLSFGARAGYRFPNANSKETINLYGFVSYHNIPVTLLTATAGLNYIETSYVNGKIFNLNVYRDFLKGNLYFNCGYQLVDYIYVGRETTAIQNIVNLNLSYNFFSKTSLSVNYETIFEKNVDQGNRLNLQIRQRF
jgi:hypothetical protein